MSIDQIREFLDIERRIFAPHNDSPHYATIGDFVLRHGDGFEPRQLPEKYKHSPVRECFKNAARLALENHGLTYVEGYAMGFMPLLHAWCVDRVGLVVEPTWRPPIPVAYLGVRFSTPLLMRALSVQEHYGLLDSMSTNFALMREPFTEESAIKMYEEIHIRQVARRTRTGRRARS